MKLATTTGDFPDHIDLFDAIRDIAAAGFRHIDLSFYTIDRDPSPFMQDDWRVYADRLMALAKELSIDFVQAHSPGSINPFSAPEAVDRLVEATIRSIEVSAYLGIPNVVIHAGWRPDSTPETAFVENRDFLARFYPVLEKTGVNLLVENSTRANMGEQYHFYDGKTMADFVRYVNHPHIHVCWDVGHALLEGHNYPDLIDLGRELHAVHIHDNSGRGDEHLPVFMGVISMDEIMAGLLDSGYTGYFTFESDSIFSAPQFRRSFGDKPSRFAELPRAMYAAAERLRYETGRCILEAYNCFEA